MDRLTVTTVRPQFAFVLNERGFSISRAYRVDSDRPGRALVSTSIRRGYIPLSTPAGAITLVVNSLDSDQYDLARPILLTVRKEDEQEFVVSFAEAEISRSGKSAEAAAAWLKSSIVELYELFKQRHNQLGPLPKRQLKVLGQYLVKKSHSKT